MSDPAALNENFDNMTVTEFEERLPDLFATGNGKISEDPRFTNFFEKNPDCAALVNDLETIADTAKGLFEPAEDEGPGPSVWDNIEKGLKGDSNSLETSAEGLETN
jgi:hypothetical protein